MTYKTQFPNWVGFDAVFNELDRMATRAKEFKLPSWPPYNVKQTGENTYVIELACAGFSKSDVELTLDGDRLIIKGNVSPDVETNYLYKGIAERAFSRTFTLADNIEVKNADLMNGMLKVVLEKFIPEDKRPKTIPVGDGLKTVKAEKQLLQE